MSHFHQEATECDRAHCIKPMVSAQSRGALFGLYGLYDQSSQRSVRRRRILKYWKKSGVFRQGVVAAESAPPRSAAHTSDPFDASLLADTGTQWCAKRAALCGYFLSLAALRFVSFCREQDARKVDEKREMRALKKSRKRRNGLPTLAFVYRAPVCCAVFRYPSSFADDSSGHVSVSTSPMVGR